jgi:hypothetical protein
MNQSINRDVSFKYFIEGKKENVMRMEYFIYKGKKEEKTCNKRRAGFFEEIWKIGVEFERGSSRRIFKTSSIWISTS